MKVQRHDIPIWDGSNKFITEETEIEDWTEQDALENKKMIENFVRNNEIENLQYDECSIKIPQVSCSFMWWVSQT